LSRLAFVLGGGGSLGAAQVGALAALTEAGITPDLVVGSSVGALNGALFSAGGATRDGVEPLRRLWLSLRRRDVFPLRLAVALAALAGRRDSLVSSQRLAALIDSRLPYRRLEDLPVAFHAIATDVETGETVALGRGAASAALLASTAFPGVFDPVTVEGRQLVDGGVGASLPVSVAARLGAEIILALPTPSFRRDRPRGALALLQRASDQLTDRLTAHEVAVTGEATEVHVVSQPPSSVSMFDFSATEALLESGYEATVDWLSRSPLTVARFEAALDEDPPIRAAS
jgi:NTE family protein